MTALPLDVLGIEILRDVIANGEWNSHNWMLLAQQDVGLRDPAASNALAEAWNWLYAKGLVARDYSKGDSSSSAVFVTRLGHEAARRGLAEMRARERLDVDLHPRFEKGVRRQFLIGEYEFAAFAALREVEIALRETCERFEQPATGRKGYGRELARFAFRDGGPIDCDAIDKSERESASDLFAGALGYFKNPSSHREVNYTDPTEAAEVILFADLLMRAIERLGAVRYNTTFDA